MKFNLAPSVKLSFTMSIFSSAIDTDSTPITQFPIKPALGVAASPMLSSPSLKTFQFLSVKASH
jgi:hypothetical protein